MNKRNQRKGFLQIFIPVAIHYGILVLIFSQPYIILHHDLYFNFHSNSKAESCHASSASPFLLKTWMKQLFGISLVFVAGVRHK